MFDVGFWELTLLAIIGLIVLGPERLPAVARTVGLWVGRARGYVRGVADELDREVRLREVREDLRRTERELSSEMRLDGDEGERREAASRAPDAADDEDR